MNQVHQIVIRGRGSRTFRPGLTDLRASGQTEGLGRAASNCVMLIGDPTKTSGQTINDKRHDIDCAVLDKLNRQRDRF